MDGDQGFLELKQLLLQAFGEELLVEAGGGRTCGGMGVQALGQGGGRERPNKRSRRADNEI